MRAPVLLLLLLAVGLGLGTVQFARSWLQGERDALSAMQDTAGPEIRVAKVLVTAGKMPSGHFLRAGDMRWQDWPEEALSEAYFTDQAVTLEDLVGAVVRAGMNSGEPITANRVVRPGDRGFLAGVLTPGMRAMAVPVNETTGIAGLVFPGDRVDLILTHGVIEELPDKSAKRVVSETVLTNRRVLAIDQLVDDLTSEPLVADNVTLELTPQEAERVNVLMSMGSLTLSLRGIAETEDALPPLIAADATEQVAGAPPAAALPAGAAAPAPAQKEPLSGEDADLKQQPDKQVAQGASQEAEDLQGGADHRLDSGIPLYPTYSLDSDVSSLLPVPAFAGESIVLFHGSRSGGGSPQN